MREDEERASTLFTFQIVNQLPLSLQSGNGGDFALNAGDLNALAAAATFNNNSSALTSPWMNTSGLHGLISSKYY